MTVKLVVLKSGENLISDIKEGIVDEKVVCYILENPCKVVINGSYKIVDENDENQNKVSISLHSWPQLSQDTVVQVPPDWVVTIVEPNIQLKEMYEGEVLNNGNDGNAGNVSDQVDSSGE